MSLDSNRMGFRSELPAEMFDKLPIAELLGDKRILIEHHQGVIAYCCSEISVRTRCGIYSVQGNKLEIAKMTRFQLVITGNIECISIYKGR